MFEKDYPMYDYFDIFGRNSTSEKINKILNDYMIDEFDNYFKVKHLPDGSIWRMTVPVQPQKAKEQSKMQKQEKFEVTWASLSNEEKNLYLCFREMDNGMIYIDYSPKEYREIFMEVSYDEWASILDDTDENVCQYFLNLKKKGLVEIVSDLPYGKSYFKFTRNGYSLLSNVL